MASAFLTASPTSSKKVGRFKDYNSMSKGSDVGGTLCIEDEDEPPVIRFQEDLFRQGNHNAEQTHLRLNTARGEATIATNCPTSSYFKVRDGSERLRRLQHSHQKKSHLNFSEHKRSIP